MASECVVCCEEFNTTTRIAVKCEHTGVCEYEACKTCIKTYLVGISTDPNCMHCNKAWSDKFLAKQLGTAFMKGDYITHRKELLVQQQLARLPETMAAAEQYKQVNAIKKHLEELVKEHKEASKQYNDMVPSIQKINSEFQVLQHDTTTDAHALIKMRVNCFKKREDLYAELNKKKETSTLIMANIRKLRHDIAVIQNGGQAVVEKKEEARKFIMPCPNTDCRGYLSSQYKCELCEHQTCARCFELIGLYKEDTVEGGDEGLGGGHVCKPENVESAEYIRKQSKPCPCCGTRISKIDGCDQMWCTQCHKAFSWNTGKIVTGMIHNPHFYQYQREHGGGVAPRNPGDVVCGGLPGLRELSDKMTQAAMPKSYQPLFDQVMTIHRLQVHFTRLSIEPLRLIVRTEQDYEKERVQYIVQEISRVELASKVFKKDKSRKINIAVLHICELFVAVAVDMFQKIMLSAKNGVDFAEELLTHVVEYDTLRQYCNEHFKDISILYGVCVPEVKANWDTDSTKYNAKGETDKYIIKREEQRKVKKDEREKRWQAHVTRLDEVQQQRVRLVDAAHRAELLQQTHV